MKIRYLTFLLLFISLSLLAQKAVYKNFKDTVLKQLSTDSLFSLASKSFFDQNAELSIHIYDLIITRNVSENNIKYSYDAHFSKAFIYTAQSQYLKSIEEYSSASDIIKNVDYSLFAISQTNKADVYLKLCNYPEARNIYLEVLNSAKEKKNVEIQYNALCSLGVLYEEAGDFDNAIRYSKIALQVAEEMDSKENQCLSLYNLSEELSKSNQTEAAFEAIEKAYSLSMQIKNFDTDIIIKYAQTLADLQRFEEAFACIDHAIPLCNGTTAIRDENSFSIARGYLFLTKKDLVSAEHIFFECISRPMNIRNQTRLNHELGKINVLKGNFAKAKHYFLKSQFVADTNQFLDYQEKNHRELYTIFSKEKNAERALFHLEKANILRDLVFNYRKSAKVTELQFKYDLAQSEQNIKDIELKGNRNLMLIGSLLSLLVIGSLVYIMRLRGRIYKASKKRSKKITEQNAQLATANESLFLKNEEIEAQKRQLEESNSLMRQFSYAVAHDLKEPLRSMSSFIQVIHRRYAALLPEESKEYFNFVTSGASRMTAMLDGLLRYSMMANEKKEEVETFDLGEVVSEVIESLRTRIEEKNAQILFNHSMLTVTMNRLHTVQLVQNLISNGLKFVEQTPIINIEAKMIGEQIVMSIKDNGIGIEKESGAKLFQLFHRVHRDSSKFEGTGVGLALCKNIVEKYNGKIWFESEMDKGTEFFVTLPKAA